MGIFDRVLPEREKLNDQEAFTGLVLTAVAADGHVAPEEAMGMYHALSRMKLYQGVSPRVFERQVNRCVALLKAKGADDFLEASAAAVREDLKATAFAVAADLLFADGHVSPEEKRFLERIQRALGVTDDLALKIVEVLEIKNLG